MRWCEAWIVAAAFALMSAVALLFLLSDRFAGRLGKMLHLFEHGGRSRINRVWPALALCQVAALLLFAGKLYLAFLMGPERVTFAACLVFSAAAIATRLVSVTPGAIGIREFLIGGIAYLTGFELRDAVIASSLDRLVEIIVVVPVGGISTWLLSRKFGAPPKPHRNISLYLATTSSHE
jgi:uncharacterized membrane protein YbhN (UPF0104 family)